MKLDFIKYFIKGLILMNNNNHTQINSKEIFDQKINNDRKKLKQIINQATLLDFEKNFFPEASIKRSLKGLSNVIVVAPYGFFGDAENTDYLAYLISKELNASYLINNKKYKSVLNENSYGEIADLNKPYLENENTKSFINKLLSSISAIRIKTSCPPIVIILLDIEKKSAENGSFDIYLTMDYESQNSDYYKSSLNISKTIFNNLNKNEYKISYEKRIYFCKNTIFHFLIKKINEIGLVNVVQIKLKYQGIRDIENISITAKNIADSLKNTKEYKIIGNLTETLNAVVLTETTPDYNLVEKACKRLTEIISKHYENAMLEAGKYIIKEFYNNEIERARNKQPYKEKSLFQLIQQLKKSGAKAPSKSWIYNAVNLSIDYEDFKNIKKYNKLLLSHKILLFTISNRKIKEFLIEEIVDNSYTINQLRSRIAEIKQNNNDYIEEKIIKEIEEKKNDLVNNDIKNESKIIEDNSIKDEDKKNDLVKSNASKSESKKSTNKDKDNYFSNFVDILKKPEILFNSANRSKLTLKFLSKFKKSDLVNIKTLTLQKKMEIQMEIEVLNSMLKEQNSIIEKYDVFIKSLDDILLD